MMFTCLFIVICFIQFEFASTLTSSSWRRKLLTRGLFGKSDDTNFSRQCQLLTQQSSRQIYDFETNESCKNPCDKISSKIIDLDETRREAAFAILGTVWAVTGTLIPTEVLFPQPANAEYGADAKIFIPNPYDSLNDRATKQCLVESLGSRQCLVYADEANFLYKGADNKVLLERLEKASTALASIPELAESKKWSQVTGVLTGPMGELIRTMVQIADLSSNVDKSKDIIKIVKTDLYAMADGVSRKDQKIVLKNHEKATNDLVAFIKSV